MTTGTTLTRYEIIACTALAVVTATITSVLFVHVLFSAPIVA